MCQTKALHQFRTCCDTKTRCLKSFVTETDGTMDVIAFTRGLVMARLMKIDEAIAELGRRWKQHQSLSCIRIIGIRCFHHFRAWDTAYRISENVYIDPARFKATANRRDAAWEQRQGTGCQRDVAGTTYKSFMDDSEVIESIRTNAGFLKSSPGRAEGQIADWGHWCLKGTDGGNVSYKKSTSGESQKRDGEALSRQQLGLYPSQTLLGHAADGG